VRLAEVLSRARQKYANRALAADGIRLVALAAPDGRISALKGA